MDGIIIIGAGILSAVMTFTANWLALIPWRRNRDKHWSEQARLVHPVVVAARSNLLIVPCVMMLVVVLLWPDSSPLWAFTGIVAVFGAYAGTLPLDREVSSRISLPELLRQALIGLLLRFLIWIIFIGACVFMPDEFNALAWAIGMAVLFLWVLWSCGGSLWVGRKLGLILPAPERLQRIASEVSSRMAIPFREVLLLRVPIAQALALPATRQIIFTERLLELCPDDEIAAICAHELAHLTESKSARASRSVAALTLLPWIFFNPLTHAYGVVAFAGLLIITLSIPRFYRKLSRKLESRADQMAKSNECDAGVYARALARLYEDNLSPAVAAKERASHPHLYDRMIAAGVTPDFPRPVGAASMAWHGNLFAISMGMLFAIFAFRLMGIFSPGGILDLHRHLSQ